jgi:serine/threonine protein kinase
LEQIGHGGMATVYRARDRRLGREVAVKIIHRHLRENWEVAQRFESEARAVAKLKHPNIVEVYDVSDKTEDERYLVVELVRGTTLRKLLTTEGYLPPEVAACIGVELADALDHAHGLGVIHRDVKPENVLIVAPGSDREITPVKLTDFGIAKLLDAQGVTSTGQVLGSPAHMAPEQIEGGDVSARADVFGLGVLLYECMVGRLPFDGKNPAQVLRRVLDGTFVAADRARATIGAAFSSVLSRALAHDANDRYASTAELATALRAELTLQGYDAPAREIQDFLQDPSGYRQAHEARVVRALVARAQSARERRDVPLAAACYNRALAYRPDDSELLANVSNLARGVKARRVLRRAAGMLLAVVTVAGAAVGVARVGQRVTARPSPSNQPAVSAPLAPSVAAPPLAAAPPTSAGELPSALPVLPRSRPTRPTPRSSAEPEAAAEHNARVQVVVSGPQNATVRIDGVETPWFGKIQELSAGEHTFEFVAPNEQCCVPGKTMKIRVPPSAGPDDVHIVQGRIEFRPATLDLRGPVGSSASCGPLGEFPVPSQHAIPLTSAERRVRCQLLPPPGSAEPPKEFDVTLRPGRLSTNLGQ